MISVKVPEIPEFNPDIEIPCPNKKCSHKFKFKLRDKGKRVIECPKCKENIEFNLT